VAAVAILAVTRIIAGTGMLRLQESARVLGIVYGALALVYQGFNVIVQAVVMPRVMEQMHAAGLPVEAMRMGMGVGLVANTLLSVALHGGLIAVLLMPDVVKAFRRQPGDEVPF